MLESTPKTGMSQESWTVIGTGIALFVALGGLMLTLSAWQRDDIQQLRTDVQQLRKDFQQSRTELGTEIDEVLRGQTETRERLARMETTISLAHPDLNVQIDTQANPNT